MHEHIVNTAERLVKKYKTRNPYEIIDALKIELIFDNEFSKLKGFYTVMNKQPYVVINNNLPDELQLMVAAHELGHDRLHRRLTKGNVLMKDTDIYNIVMKPEYEANLFAATLLISDSDITELAERGYEMQKIAGILGVDINLVGIKLNYMNQNGYKYNVAITPAGNFLK